MDAVKIIRDARWRLEVGDITREQYEELIAPLRDVEAVVRCKDCTHAHMTYDGKCKYCDIWFPGDAVYVDGDYYCASGELKEGGDG